MKMIIQMPILSADRKIKIALYIVLFLIMDISLTGCMTYFAATYDSPPSNLDQLKEGVDRKTVESVLGKPKQKTNNVSTYEYNTRQIPPLWTAIFLDIYTFGTSAVFYGDLKKGEAAGKASLKIVFSPRDTVVNLNYDHAEQEYLRWINGTNRYEEIGLLCSSANDGYARTQVIQAMRYRYGLYNTATDNSQAYFWLKLADFGGQHNIQEVMTAWSGSMTSGEIEAAEKAFREWKSESCEK